MKVAILICGPYRYLEKVIERLESLAPSSLDFGIFCFCWKQDSGERKRNAGFDFDAIAHLRQQERVYSVIEAEPIGADQFEEYGAYTGCHSPHQNIYGMFYSISEILDVVPLEFTHALRLRTDCLLIDSTFFDSFLSAGNRTLVSNNPGLPVGWVSDHLMYSSVRIMKEVWFAGGVREFMADYDAAGRNPERMLAQRVKDVGVVVVKKWKRYADYQIVYDKSTSDDPVVLNEFCEGVDLFAVEFSDRQKMMLLDHFDVVAARYSDSFLARLVRFVRRVVGC